MITIISRAEIEKTRMCPICAEDKDYKLKRRFEGTYRQYVVFTCPNCETRFEFNRTAEDYKK